MGDNSFKCLSHILTDEEIKQISSYIRIKLESHLEGKKLAIDNMKNQLASSAANAEKKSFAVDRELQNEKSKLKMAEEFAEKLKNQLREAEEALQKSRHDYYETLQCKESLTYELNVVKEKLERFTNEKLDLSELLDRRLEEIKNLQMEIKNLNSKLQSYSEGRIETTIKAEEIELRMLSIQHQDMRMNQERQLYQKQIATLNEELNLKVNELLALRRERAVQLFELQSNLEQKTEEHSKCIEEIKHLKQVVDKKDKHIDSLATRIREMQQYSAQLEEDYQNEIAAQNNLIELHKQSSLDFKKRNETLVETIEEMQKLLQAAQQAHSELETTFNESQTNLSEQINKLAEENNALIKESEDLKESIANSSRENLEAEFEKQYPLAATTKKLLKNNMSFTQIFNELVRAQQELEDQKSENTVLKEHLRQVASEAEENAPLLHRKIQEHQRALQNISELQNQISSMITDREQWLLEKDTLIRMNKQFEREIKRYENENMDLAKQIRALIKSVQEARGFTVSHEQDSQISSSDNYVPQELVTFRDIEDLQTKNQQLMNALREVKEKLEKFEEEKGNDQRYALQRDLDEALVQLENLRAERRQQAEMVEALVQQRDLYKMIASHSNEPNQVQRSPVAFTSSPYSSAARINVDEHNELKSNLDKITKEYANFREESSKRMKDLTGANEKFREEISSAKIEMAKISSELTFTQERLQIFKTNMEQFQRENGLLRERNTILNENVKKHEQSLVLMRQDVLSANDKLNRLEITNESLKAERDLFRNNELKLLQEKEIMIRNQENQNKLINTLQSVQSNLNRMESDSIKNLKLQNDKLEKECAYLKSRYEKERERHSEASAVWEKHSQDLQTRIDNEIEKYLKVHQELTEYQAKAQQLENELNSLKMGQNQATSVDISSSNESLRALQSQISVMREQYTEAQNEIKLLRDKLNNAHKACDSLKTINSVLEEKLNEHKLSTEDIQVKADSILSEKESLINSLRNELVEYKNRYAKVEQERLSLENDHKNITQQHLDRINELTNSLIDANSRAEKASLNEQRAIEDRNCQLAIAAEAQANYERELQLHSNDAQVINSMRKQLESLHNKVIEAESAANKAQQQLAQSHEMWINERKNIELNQEKIKEKCSDLERINQTLNQQLELLNDRIIALQNSSNMPLLSKEEAVENTNRLLEVIKFLRKEKEILQTQISAIESEDSRLKIVIENLKKELAHTQNELKEEKIQSKTLMTNVSQHSELVKKIEMINILTESNALLRSEKTSLEAKCQELSDKLSKIDNENLSKEIEQLTLKIETKTAENHALREELKHWQTRTNNLTEQLNKTSPEDFKRLNEERNKLQQQVSNSAQEFNKISSELETQKSACKNLETQIQSARNELDSKNSEINRLSSELNSSRSENTTTQNTIVQLRKVARKYKMQFDELKVEFDKIKENENKSAVASSTEENNDNKSAAQESQMAELLQKIEESNSKVQELSQQIEKLNNDLIQINEEKEAAKSQANEKEEKAKKIAHQAKQRIAALSTEKMNLLKDKEKVEKCVEEMREKIKVMEQNAEESTLRLASIKSQYDAKMSRQERELSEAHKQIEDFKLRLQSSQVLQSQQQLQQQTSAAIGVTAPVQSSSQSSSTPVRHSVHPQQSLSAKSTPTASIRPLAVAPTHVHRTPRSSTVSQSRTATVATVQPTTEESTSHQSVPHATVQPTQTVTSQMAFVPPTSSTESEIITAHNEDDSFDESSNITQTQRPVELSSDVPETIGAHTDSNNSSAPQEVRDDVPPQLSGPYQLRHEEPECSTSAQVDRNKEKVTLKRSRKPSEELNRPFSPKKVRTESECESIRPQTEDSSHQEILTSDKSSDGSIQQSQQSFRSGGVSRDIQENKPVIGQTVEDDDDDVIILESDESDEEQKAEDGEHGDEEEVEEEGEEESFDEAEDEENVEEGSEGYEQEDYNEEMSNGSHYDEENEQSDDNNERVEEDIEVIGVSDDRQQDQHVIGEQMSSACHQSLNEQISSERSDPNVSTTLPSLQTTSIVTSSSESVPIRSNPFIQVPTPIQRPFASGRQSFYLSHAQQTSNYDEGDGIVPSTPTLFVPRRGDSFADALNSPRVPQGRFVFSSSIPEASALSQLASEGTLGVDDTRMDLSQFDDNGRSVPTTPLAVSPAIDSAVHSTVQSSDIDQDSDQNYSIDPAVVGEAPITTEFDNENSDSSRINVETDEGQNSRTSIKDGNGGAVSGGDVTDANEGIEEEAGEQIDTETDTQIEEEAKEVSDVKSDDNQNVYEQDSNPTASTSTSNIQRHLQTARRGRAFGSQRVIQRRPIVWPSEPSGDMSPSKQSTAPNVSQMQQQPQSSHQAGRRIRLRGSSSKFSTRGDFRGGRPGRGSRGSYHYSK